MYLANWVLECLIYIQEAEGKILYNCIKTEEIKKYANAEEELRNGKTRIITSVSNMIGAGISALLNPWKGERGGEGDWGGDTPISSTSTSTLKCSLISKVNSANLYFFVLFE